MTTEITLDHRTVEGDATKPIARYLPTFGRIVMGAIFFLFGLDGFLHVLPQPSGPIPSGAMAFGGALMNSGYMFPLIKGTEVLAGALLLSNRFVPLALVLIAPVVVNIFAFHAFLDPSGVGLASVILALEILLAWRYRNVYRPMLSMGAATEPK
jgi:uncharacterized membrane protein YphA (DoxX/SURF4 family)